MSIALVFLNEDFSDNALKQVHYDGGIQWRTVDMTGITHNDGFVWGSTGTVPGKVESSASWGTMFGYTDVIDITGAVAVQGFTSALDIANKGDGTYNRFPAVVFYDANDTYVSEINGADFEEMETELHYPDVTFQTYAYRGTFYADVPTNAAKMRIQYVHGNLENQTTAAKIGDLTPIFVQTPTAQIGENS